MRGRTQERKFSLISRLVGMLACMALLVIALTWWWVGFSLVLGLATLGALCALSGPVMVEAGGGVLDFLSGLFELICEVVSTIADAISSLFSSVT